MQQLIQSVSLIAKLLVRWVGAADMAAGKAAGKAVGKAAGMVVGMVVE